MRKLSVIAGSILLAVLVAGAAYDSATAPPRREGKPLYTFDPDVVGHMEQRAWAQYYLKDWLGLFDSMLRMIRGQFGLSLPQAIYASYENTLAQVAWAQHGREGGEAEARMKRFFDFVREPSGGSYDSARAAVTEVDWWAVHRNRDSYPDRTALTQALAVDYAEIFQLPADRFIASAASRAEAMDLSDQWIREGKHADSPLLGEISTLLVRSYRALAEVVREK